MSDQMIVMADGVIQQAESPRTVYSRPNNRFVAGFLGATSLFRGKVCACHDNGVDVRIGGYTLTASAGSSCFEVGDEIDCAVRAEQIGLEPGENRQAAASQVLDEAVSPGTQNRVVGQVRQVVFEGDRIVYEVHVPDMDDALVQVFVHDLEGHVEQKTGSAVSLTWNAAALYAFPVAES